MRQYWILYTALLVILGLLVFITFTLSASVRRWFSRIALKLRVLMSLMGLTKGADTPPAVESPEVAGYAYDPRQDIFYTVLAPWQKKYGYCRLYDELAAPMGMIVDCEPVYFDYEGKKWLIEFWKGQYDMACGSEIGVYTSKGPDLNIPGVFNGTFYKCPDEADYLQIACCLKKDGRVLFLRSDRHWWLTGFKLGGFAEPSELTLYISITLKDKDMCSLFIKGLKKTGYLDYEYAVSGNTVSLIYSKPHSPQPLTRSKSTDAIIQSKNRFLCERYEEVTEGCKTQQEKFQAVQHKAPDIYGYISGLGRPKKLYDVYDIQGG